MLRVGRIPYINCYGGDAIDERDNTRLYAGVIVTEVVVFVALWLFQRYFGA